MAIILVYLFSFSENVYAKKARYGFYTKFAEVTLSGLKPGMIYSLKEEQKLPYKVVNSADRKRNVEVVVVVPQEQHLRKGYEPIPDISWVKVIPDRFELNPGESTNCDLIISIPDDEKYANRHYQAMIRTQTVEDPDVKGVAVSVAIQTRFKFSTGPTPAVERAEYRKKVLEALKIEMMPFSLKVGELEMGNEIILDGFNYSTPQLINRGRESYEIDLNIAKDPKNYGLAQGYEPIPDDINIELENKNIKLKSRRIEDIIMRLRIPDKKKYDGKKFAFVIVAEVKWKELPIKLYSRVYFKINERK